MAASSKSNIDKLRGKFIVFDGPDGSGKSTQREMFGDRIAGLGAEVVHCRDPGGTEFGDMIRSILLTHDLSQMDVRCETFLFMASRAQLAGQVIEPALREGKTVLCDRFISSTCAYQVAAGYDVQRVLELGQYAIENIWPDLTIIFDVDSEQGFERTGRQPHHAGKNRRKDIGQGTLLSDVQHDAMEARPLAFHRRVRQAFLKLPDIYPKPVVIVNGRGEPDQVHALVWKAVGRATL